MQSIHEFLEDRYERLNGGEATKEEIRDMVNTLLEMAKSDEREFRNQYIRLILHMLKYVYQPVKQSGFWIDSIRDSHRHLVEMVDDKSLMRVVLQDLSKCYFKARRFAAGETRLPLSTFPVECPSEWTIENITDYDFLDDFLVKNAYSEEAKKYLGL